MMKTSKYNLGLKSLSVFLFLSFIFYMLCTGDSGLEKHNCQLYNDFKKIKYDGIVISSYKDTDNHGYPILIVKNRDGKVVTFNFEYCLVNEYFIPYTFHAGDSLFKTEGSIVIRKVNITGTQIDTLKFVCNSEH